MIGMLKFKLILKHPAEEDFKILWLIIDNNAKKKRLDQQNVLLYQLSEFIKIERLYHRETFI